MSRPGHYPTLVYPAMVLLFTLGAYQACQCVEWTYGLIVAIIAADVKAQRDGGRYIRHCDWDKCITAWEANR